MRKDRIFLKANSIKKGLKTLENPQAQGILHAANDVADDRPDHDSMVAGLLSRLESKLEITRFALRSALDGVRLGGLLRHPHKLTTDAIARCQARTAVQGG